MRYFSWKDPAADYERVHEAIPWEAVAVGTDGIVECALMTGIEVNRKSTAY